MNLDDAINLDDLRKLAKRRIPKVVYDFIEGGVDDEDGLSRNEQAFAQCPLMPRYLVDVSTRDQSRELFGRTWSSPFGIAPTGGIWLYRYGGDMMLARAARDANVPFIMSGAATASMEEMAEIAPEHGWYQMYVAKDKSISEDMIRRADALGLSTLVVTVDVPAGANRERNKRNGFGRPLKLSLLAKLDALRRPLWLKDYLEHGRPTFPNWQPYAPATIRDDPDAMGDFVTSQVRAPLTWEDVERFRELWPRNLVLKGIMRVDDARRAADLGVDGIMVSNHGARQLDRAPSPLEVLPGIDSAVGERVTLMLDSGVRRGADAL
ncbi:MAG: alpha-hydroxy-acid oxidizing protein, partial [Gammaproteobacteria bacterium]|nr:alpha-hydroxy-acid oxidizing protein [Gammaproteobacteria bacterium]